MSTRCQIGLYEKKEDKLKDWEVLLYRHSDGYPEGVLPELEAFLKWWNKGRGISDTEYGGARLLQYLCNEYDRFTVEMYKDNPSWTPTQCKTGDLTGMLGYGISKAWHGDIEYYYKVYPSAIEVYRVRYIGFDKSHADKDFELIKTVELKEKVAA